MHVILDYGLGNTASVLKSVTAAGFSASISREKQALQDAETIILPGVGSFRDAMSRLHSLDFVPLLNHLVLEKKKRFLGICLGMQLLGDKGYEDGETAGLGWIRGEVKQIPQCGQRIPHMGWNNIELVHSDSLRTLEDKNFYFMHSYYFDAEPQYVTSTVNHGVQLVSTVAKGNIYGAQFHPEKSQTNGLAYLQYVLNQPC